MEASTAMLLQSGRGDFHSRNRVKKVSHLGQFVDSNLMIETFRERPVPDLYDLYGLYDLYDLAMLSSESCAICMI